MKHWLWLVIAVGLLGLVFGLSAWYGVPLLEWPQAIGFQKEPYLVYEGNNHEMTVLWELDASAESILEWGRDASSPEGRATTYEMSEHHQHRYTICDLEPGALYAFRVTVGETTRVGSFRAAPGEEERSVKFFAYGDTRSHPDRHDRVCAAILDVIAQDEVSQTFLLHAGDWVSDGDRETAWAEERFCDDWSNATALQRCLPILGCMGNHEGSGELFQVHWPYPFVADRYWSFDYGPVHVAIVDQYAGFGLESAQYNWLENDLRESTKLWKFVVLHEPGWSAGHHPNNVAVQTLVQPLCRTFGVTMVIAGHNHYYARCHVDGVWHVTTGGGGAPLYSPDPNAPYLVAAHRALHFCMIDIAGDRLTFRAMGEDGTILDTFSVTKPQ